MVLIVDSKTQLLGVITDGDIRRALLNNLRLEVALSEVMNTSPICAEVGTPKEQLIETMEQKGILSIPVVRQVKWLGYRPSSMC